MNRRLGYGQQPMFMTKKGQGVLIYYKKISYFVSGELLLQCCSEYDVSLHVYMKRLSGKVYFVLFIPILSYLRVDNHGIWCKC